MSVVVGTSDGVAGVSSFNVGDHQYLPEKFSNFHIEKIHHLCHLFCGIFPISTIHQRYN
jgi:hypothetical protein